MYIAKQFSWHLIFQPFISHSTKLAINVYILYKELILVAFQHTASLHPIFSILLLYFIIINQNAICLKLKYNTDEHTFKREIKKITAGRHSALHKKIIEFQISNFQNVETLNKHSKPEKKLSFCL